MLLRNHPSRGSDRPSGLTWPGVISIVRALATTQLGRRYGAAMGL